MSFLSLEPFASIGANYTHVFPFIYARLAKASLACLALLRLI
jgi:hypothetical protein